MEKLLVEPFFVMKVLERAKELEKEGKEVIHLEIGEPDLPVPERVKERAKEFLSKFEQKYTESTGIYPLKEAIAHYYEKTYGVKVEPERVVITPGSSPGLLALLKVVRERVGEISYPDPGYPCYKNVLKFLNLKGRGVPIYPEEEFKVKAERVETHALIVNSPSNPTGVIYSKEELKALSEKAFLISDEIYHGLVYDERAPSALEVSNNCAVVNGFSKFFLMTGWRLGWMVVPKELLPDITAILQNTVISPPTLSQYAALACFEEEVLEELSSNAEIFRKRRDVLLKGLKELGFKIPAEPKGAFYIYADASRFTDDSFKFAFEVLEKTAVAITPGRDFGENQTEKFVRFSFCTSVEKIEEALERLRGFLA
ncbi:aminotransferase class I/II-fold pyridoxal phosphate-dependent enzyme [Thermovibrio sp.]